jgi:hypothetical protein
MYYIAVAGTLSGICGRASFFVTLATYSVILAKGWGDLPPLDVMRVFTSVQPRTSFASVSAN